jgi:hypothetical protein
VENLGGTAEQRRAQRVLLSNSTTASAINILQNKLFIEVDCNIARNKSQETKRLSKNALDETRFFL